MAYINAYQDLDFLEQGECRGIRLQLEFMKPDFEMRKHNIVSTIVVFGSARTPDPGKAVAALEEAEAALAKNPQDSALKRRVNMARHQVNLSRYYDVAYDFGRLVTQECQTEARREFVICTGGGPGIMEAANRGAADAGGISMGLNIALPFEQAPNPYITPELSFHFRYFSMRKMHFLYRAKALCICPGGYGTMDELFEALTLIQTRKIPAMPVVLFGKEFWRQLIDWELFVERGLICEHDLQLFRVCETADEAWEYIRNFWREEEFLKSNVSGNNR